MRSLTLNITILPVQSMLQNFQLTCSDDLRWTGDAPTQCSLNSPIVREQPSIAHGSVTCGDSADGMFECHVRCSDGYILEGEPVLRFNALSWREYSRVPQCVAYVCERPPESNSIMLIRCDSLELGGQCSAQCRYAPNTSRDILDLQHA